MQIVEEKKEKGNLLPPNSTDRILGEGVGFLGPGGTPGGFSHKEILSLAGKKALFPQEGGGTVFHLAKPR